MNYYEVPYIEPVEINGASTGSAAVGFIVPGFLSQFDGSEQKLSEL